MPVLFKDFRVNDFSRRHTVYSKIKRVTNSGFDTSNDYFGDNFTRLLGLNDNSKDYFSYGAADIIYVSSLNMFVACGQNAQSDKRNNLSTFLYSNDGVSWSFANDTFDNIPSNGKTLPGFGGELFLSNSFIFCTGRGGSGGNLQLLMKSSDGINWNNVPVDNLNLIISMVTDGSGKLLVFGENSSSVFTLLGSTNNGDTWVTIELTSIIGTGNIESCKLFYVNGRFYVMIDTDNGPTHIIYSTDLSNWMDISSNFTSDGTSVQLINFYSIAFGNNKYVVSGVIQNHDVILFSSTDGIIWSKSMDMNQDDNPTIIYNSGNSLFYLYNIYDYDIILYSSSDGNTWNPILESTQITQYLPPGSSLQYISNVCISDSKLFMMSVCADNTNYNNTIAIGLIITELDGTPDTSMRLKKIITGGYVNSITTNNTNIVVGIVTDSGSPLSNSIYYQPVSGNRLLATEHVDDV